MSKILDKRGEEKNRENKTLSQNKTINGTNTYSLRVFEYILVENES